MKKTIIYILLFSPFLTFGQLFPTISALNGEIDKITEKHYGREVYFFRKSTGLYFPKMYSGWKCKFYYDENSNLTKRVNKYKGSIRAKYKYQRDTVSS